MVIARTDRRLLTVLFTDVVESTKRASELGDRAWRSLLDQHDALVRSAISAGRGTEIGTAGDSFGATFLQPAAALHCAERIVQDVRGLGLQIRAGAHTGEVEQRGTEIAGITVHIAARVSALAGGGEVLVTGTVKDLVAGSDLRFQSRGTHALKGVPGRRSLHALVQENRHRDGCEPAAALPRVLLADDHPLWRETLAALLEGSGAAEVIGQAGNGEEAVVMAARLRPDIVMLDVDMPTTNGIDAARGICSALPDTRVVMLSSIADRDEVLAAVAAGASGYLLKTADASEIRSAVQRVGSGEMVFPPALAAVVLAAVRDAGKPSSDSELGSLTVQEHRVLEAVSRGLSNAAIAADLHLSVKTVEAHLSSVYTKLGLESSASSDRRVQAALTFKAAQPRPGRDNP